MELFYVCRMNDEGNWVGLRSTTDEDYAESLCDYYSEVYHNSYVDILSHSDFHNN